LSSSKLPKSSSKSINNKYSDLDTIVYVKSLNISERIQAKKKISRKLGGSLWGKAKDPYLKRNYRPGQHGSAPKGRSSDYGNQLRAKQRMKFVYGNISEKQFYNTFKLASIILLNSADKVISLYLSAPI
jgi:small subunit ribosomal protein S4